MGKNQDKLIEESVRIARSLIIDEFKEHFIGIYLDENKKIIWSEIISIGTLTSGIVHPREVFKPALKMRACYVILLHNHPSGDITPTGSDIETTEQLIKAGELLGVEVTEHIIFSGDDFRSISTNPL